MRVVVGLGNPGPKYAETRHNFGFLCLQALSDKLQVEKANLLEEDCQSQLARWQRWELASGCQVVLLWPLTFMNLSGLALTALLSRFPVESSDLVVLSDDMSLPLGQLRLRRKGSSGGHNGLKSIEAALGHQDYPRLRLGIGAPEEGQVVIDFVLERFLEEDRETVETVVAFSTERIFEWIDGVSLDALMGKVNGWRGTKEVEG